MKYAFRRPLLAALAAAALSPLAAFAQGVTADTILVGQTGALTGPADEIGTASKAGIEAYFNAVNAAGGIGGRKLQLISLDDAGDSKKAKENVQNLIEKHGVIAVLGMNGDPGIRASYAQFEKGKTALIGAISGEPGLFENTNRYIINLRASYAQEAKRIVDQYTQRKITRIALFFQNDAAGRGGLAALDAAMREKGLPIVLFGSVEAHSTNTATAAQNLHKSGAEAIIISAGARSAASFIKDMKKLGSQAQFFALSMVGARTLQNLLGEDGRGVGVSQVVPLPTSESEPLGKEYVKAVGGTANTSFASLEGYIGARVLVEALKRAGKTPTRESLIDAIDKIGNFDLQGYKVRLSPTARNGSSLVELTVIGAQGYRK
jgi:ABC-type branched-subunit amino acid transport system substrate-binding protein